nr:O-antigen ligase family protein [Candidatus Bipolaricaulota bacterium]
RMATGARHDVAPPGRKWLLAGLVLAVLVMTQLKEPVLLPILRLNQWLILVLVGCVASYELNRRRLVMDATTLSVVRPVLVLGTTLSITTCIGIIAGTTDPALALPELRELLLGGLFFIGLCLCPDLVRWRSRLWNGFLNISVLLALTYTVTDLIGHPAGRMLFESPFDGYRAVGGFTGPNEFGAFLALISTAVLGRLVNRARWRDRLLDAIGIGICWWVLVQTSSRSGILGAGLGALVVAGQVLLWLAPLRVRRRWRVGLGALAVLLVFLGVAILSSSPGDALLRRVETDGWGDTQRIAILEGAWELYVESPAWGLGLGGYAANSERVTGLVEKVVHNEYANFLVSGGILGIGALLWLFVRGLKIAWQGARGDPYSIGLLAALVVFVAEELQFNYLTRHKLSVVFWFVLWVAATQTGSLRMTERRRFGWIEHNISTSDPALPRICCPETEARESVPKEAE